MNGEGDGLFLKKNKELHIVWSDSHIWLVLKLRSSADESIIRFTPTELVLNVLTEKARMNLNDNHTWAPSNQGNSIDSDRKRMTTVHKLGQDWMVVIIYLSPKVLQK